MNKHKNLAIIGAGGHGRVVADCAEQTNKYDKIFFLDDSFAERKSNAEWNIIGPVSDWKKYRGDTDFIVALGSNALRAQLQKELQKNNVSIATLVHPTAFVSHYSELGSGVVVFANAVINIGSNVADGCIVNTGATVDHDCSIGTFCHISPGANLAGGIKVGNMSWLGIGCSVVECVVIGENCQIGAGAVVTENTTNNFLYLGIPAKAVRPLKLKK